MDVYCFHAILKSKNCYLEHRKLVTVYIQNAFFIKQVFLL